MVQRHAYFDSASRWRRLAQRGFILGSALYVVSISCFRYKASAILVVGYVRTEFSRTPGPAGASPVVDVRFMSLVSVIS